MVIYFLHRLTSYLHIAITAELWLLEGCGRATKQNAILIGTHELLFPWLSWLAAFLIDTYT